MRQWIPAVPQVRVHHAVMGNPHARGMALAIIGHCFIFPFLLFFFIYLKVRELHSIKQELAELIPKKQNEIKELKAKHKDTVIGEVTVDQIYGGMRDIKGLVTETSLLDANEVASGICRDPPCTISLSRFRVFAFVGTQ